MADAKAEFTETLKRILRVSKPEIDKEERKWQEEQRQADRRA